MKNPYCRRLHSVSVLFILCVSFVGLHGFRPCCTERWGSPGPSSRTSTRLAFALTSALESVAENNDQARKFLTWMDPSSEDSMPLISCDSVDDDDDDRTMPLYPLGATYLPAAGVNYTIRNTEPRNLQMARDLGASGRFCAVLRAADTGRVATVGTVLRTLEEDRQHNAAGDLVRVVWTCQAEQVVDILEILNPQAASWESRLKRSSEYLVAQVRPRSGHPGGNVGTIASDEAIGSSLVQDYNAVRELYMQGIGTSDLPPFARDKALPVVTHVSSPDAFWQTAVDWQSWCYTVREGCQIALAADRNEQLVQAAMRKRGALRLPIHLEDVEPSVRREIQSLEGTAQEKWLRLELDPCVDFQVLLALRSDRDRLQHLAGMLRRKLLRLERLKARLGDEMAPPAITTKPDNTMENFSEELQSQRKGAWFNDDYW